MLGEDVARRGQLGLGQPQLVPDDVEDPRTPRVHGPAGDVLGPQPAPGDQLGLAEEQLATSRHVLAEHGNCSSATVLLVLEELADADGPVVAMAFGPGLTLYAALLLPA